MAPLDNDHTQSHGQSLGQPLDKAAGLTREELDAHWMPFSGNRQFKNNPRMIVKAEGTWYWDAEGRKIYDSLSGLWCSGAGHCRREISEAVARQIAELDYSPAFQHGHPAAFKLAHKLASLTPAGLDHVFFVGSGSEAADTSPATATAPPSPAETAAKAAVAEVAEVTKADRTPASAESVSTTSEQPHQAVDVAPESTSQAEAAADAAAPTSSPITPTSAEATIVEPAAEETVNSDAADDRQAAAAMAGPDTPRQPGLLDAAPAETPATGEAEAPASMNVEGQEQPKP